MLADMLLSCQEVVLTQLLIGSACPPIFQVYVRTSSMNRQSPGKLSDCRRKGDESVARGQRTDGIPKRAVAKDHTIIRRRFKNSPDSLQLPTGGDIALINNELFRMVESRATGQHVFIVARGNHLCRDYGNCCSDPFDKINSLMQTDFALWINFDDIWSE